jgi:copper chaperone
METMKFTTTMKCSSCLAKATPHLNEAAGEDNWKVDTANPSKILTVSGEQDQSRIIEAVEKAGFKAQVIQ